MAALLAGQSVSKVAEEYAIPKGTVSSWKNRKVAKVASAAAVDATDATQKNRDVGDLLHKLITANLTGLIAVAELLTDREWLKSQGAAELATLAGVTCDKTVRLLEAMRGEVPAEVEAPVAPVASTASAAPATSTAPAAP